MSLPRCLSAAVVFAALAGSLHAADKLVLKDGNYLLSYNPGSPAQVPLALLKVASKGEKYDVEVLDGGQAAWKVANFKTDGKLFTADVETAGNKLKFEGITDAKAKEPAVLGSFGDDGRLFRATLTFTEDEKLGTAKAPKLSDDQLALNKIRSAANVFRGQAQRETDADKRRELLEKAAEAQKEAEAKVPGLLLKVIDGETDGLSKFFAGQELLIAAGKAKSSVKDVAKWAEGVVTYAAAHGPRFEQDTLFKVAEILAAQPALAEVSLGYAQKAVKIAEKSAVGKQVRAIKALLAAQKASKMTMEAAATEATLAKLELALDVEYKKAVPPFKPAKYEGRKEKDANRVVVFELFTGAQCPPCVAADVAFDALEKAYEPKDLVLIQYHMHIPGPDPLTNLDSISRWDYYLKKFPEGIRGTPSTLFNGKPDAGGGGGMANAKSKFDQYAKLIDKVLEEKSDVKLEGAAALIGENLSVNLKVAGLKDPSADLKVRLLLVEEEIRYVGGNQLRFHHQVVRSQFAKADGFSVKDLKDGVLTAKLNLDDVRKDLAKYLESYEKTRPFPNADRPMALKKIKVIALIQDDESKEILQAIQLDVTGAKS